MTPKLPPLAPAGDVSADTPVVVGIDPGDVTGLAVWSPAASRLLYVGSGHFFEVLSVVARHVRPHPHPPGAPVWAASSVVVEDNRRAPIYARNAAARGPARDKLCRNVGRVDRDVELWASWLKTRGLEVRLAEPVRGKKWDAETLARLTGWAEPSNEHARDAARLVFGRPLRAPPT